MSDDELQLANFLRKEGLTWEEIAYLRWRDFDFDMTSIKVHRSLSVFKITKTVNLRKNKEILHFIKRFNEKCYRTRNFFIFYKVMPKSVARFADPSRYGEPFRPGEIREKVKTYRGENRGIFRLRLQRI